MHIKTKKNCLGVCEREGRREREREREIKKEKKFLFFPACLINKLEKKFCLYMGVAS